jgi:hypothetical protein
MPEDYMAVDTSYDPLAGKEEGDVGKDQMMMETDDQLDDNRFVVVGGADSKKKNTETVNRQQTDAAELGNFLPTSLAIGDGNVQFGRAIKKAMKKRKKNEKKMTKKAEKLASQLGTGMEI